MRIAASDYERMRAWFALVVPRVFPLELLKPETDPVVALDVIATRSMAKARQGLAVAIGDLVEMASGVDESSIAALDVELSAAGLPAFAEARALFSKGVQRVMRRGRIEDEDEHYAVRNAAEMPGADLEKLRALLGEYEVRLMSERGIKT